MRLVNTVDNISIRAKNAVECVSPIWDKLSEDSKRAVNKAKDKASKEGK